MKRFASLLSLCLLSLTGCDRSVSGPEAETYAGYIFFAPQVETKATLIESAAGMKFGVVGFKYDNSLSWNDFKANLHTPNVFYDENGNWVSAETVTCDDQGYGSYAPLQGWSNTKKYAFFAYYPIANQQVTLVNPTTGSDYAGGVPAIRYAMNPTNLQGSMVDVMTAVPHYDLQGNTGSASNQQVLFSFSHCLSSLGLSLENSSSAPVELFGVKVTVNGIQHQQLMIPLDGTATTATSAAAPMSLTDAALALFQTEKVLYADGRLELSDKLIFIPQDADITVKVQLTYRRKFENGTTGQMESKISPELSTKLSQGKKHLIHINFKESTVEVKPVVDEQGWVEQPEVEDTFN